MSVPKHSEGQASKQANHSSRTGRLTDKVLVFGEVPGVAQQSSKQSFVRAAPDASSDEQTSERYVCQNWNYTEAS
jgi:hypothetical protein